MKNKKYTYATITIVILFLAAIVAVVALKTRQPKPFKAKLVNGPEVLKAASVPPLQVQNSSTGTLPSLLPKDLPVESGAKILQNQTLKNPQTGQTQASLVFSSNKGLQENLDLYQKYLADNKWQNINTINKDNIKAVSGYDAGGSIMIMVTPAPAGSGQSVVNISYTQKFFIPASQTSGK